MKQEFLLPDLGEGLAEAEIVQWMVAVGDTVALNQTPAEVETAKAIVELPSPYAGTITVLHAEAGQTVDVGAPLIGFDIKKDGHADTATAMPGDADLNAHSDDDAHSANDEKAQPNLVGYGAEPASKGRPARRARRQDKNVRADASTQETDVLAAAPHDADVAVPERETLHERPRSTPPVRKYAKDHGVDLALVSASLPQTERAKVITRADVDVYLRGLKQVEPEPALPEIVSPRDEQTRTTRVPVRGVRKLTAEAMVRSAFTAPHVTVFHTVDVTATTRLLDSLRQDRALSGQRIGPLAIVAKAVCLALPHFENLNAFWDEQSHEIVHNHFVDLGIAAATERGLIVPVIRDAHTMSLVDLAESLSVLAATARTGKTSPADLAGGTFSLTNIGVFGIDAGTPILPPGQSGILAVGAIRRQPWEHSGEVALRDVMTLSLSFDHRLVDGQQGSQFLKAVCDTLQEPGRAMLF